MAKRVPLARRNILAERRRLVMSLLGVGAAVALVLLLQGLWSGTRLQVSAYQDNVEADLYVAEIGTKNFATDNSVVPEGIAKSIGELPKVDGVAPIISRWALLDLHARKQGVALIGSQPGQMGGPWRFSAGRAVEAADEVAVDEVTADQHGLSLGDTIEVIGHDVEIVGLVSGARTWMTGMAFVSLDALQEMQRTPRAVSFLLVDTARPEEVAAQIRERFDVTTLGAAELADNERNLFAGIIGGPLDFMIAIAFTAGILIVALTVYSSIVERIREYGIVKAVGARGRDIARTVLAQTLLIAIAGTAVGFLLYLGGSRLIVELKPQFWTRLSATAAITVASSSLLMAVLAAIVPIRKLARLDPASVYRGAE